MISGSSRQIYDYSSLNPTEASVRCEATLELGRKLTKELGLDQSVDTLGRWMAHYIAELMQNAEEASTEERATKMQLCHDAILSLWEHRYTFVNGKRPFEGLEPVLQTLKDLSIEGGRQRYFRCLYTNDDITNENDEVQYWLRFIDELDYSAKTIIQYCLVHAAQNVLDQSMEWVKLAEVADVEESIEFPIIRMITDESDLLKVPDPSSEERKRIEERIERLEKFSQMATKVVTDLRNRSPLVHL